MPDEEVDLSFEASGKIVDINFTEGTFCKKGQLLAKVNDSQLQAQLKRLEAQMPLAEDRVFRQNALLQRDAVSKEAYEQVKTELATLHADIENVKANIAMTELRAPFDGVIGLRQVSVGAYASPSTVIAKLTKITPLKVEFGIPERYARQVKKGTNLDFMITGRLETFRAQVYATESRIDPNTLTLTVRALYPNTQGELIPGRYADIQLKREEIKDAIAIPSEATKASWVGLPPFQLCKFDLTAILVMAPIAIASMMEHIGDMSAISATVGENFIEDPGLHRTLIGDGLATSLSALVGGPANTTYGENTGVLELSKVYDPRVIRIAANFLQ